MNILFIAPVPPPINGQSKASKVLLDGLIHEKFKVTVVNTSKKNLKSGLDSFKRIFEIFHIWFKVWRNRKGKDIIYISLAESFLGNLRDIVIYLICYKNISKVHVHMLGGAGMHHILKNTNLQRKINSFFLCRLGGVIVEGDLNFNLFSKFVDFNKILIVPNFAEDYLFAIDEEIKDKYASKDNIQILYLSNLLPGKGYIELVNAFLQLPEKIKSMLNLVFVGGFESSEDHNYFLSLIKNEERIKYLGKFIDGIEKRRLYASSQIFCLPTYYPYEGQPISILEAYAMGCVVITTNHSGIPYVFSKKNGYFVEKKSVDSLINVICQLFDKQDEFEKIAFFNKDMAMQKFRTSIFQSKIINWFTLFNNIN